MLVCSLGDLTLDVLVRLSGPIAAGGDTDSEITLSPGGQGANVAAWVAALGGRARFVGKHGIDEAGRLAREGLERRGVEVVGPATGANGIVCSLVSPDGERSMPRGRSIGEDGQEHGHERCGSPARKWRPFCDGPHSATPRG